MTDNVVNFPGKMKTNKELLVSGDPEIQKIVAETLPAHHFELFSYSDDSYVILIQPKEKEFTDERVVYMAERLKTEILNFEFEDELE